MAIVVKLLVVLVALEHMWFLVLEMFLWNKPIGRKTFNNTKEKAEITATLAANQGLYNGFLAAGLIWSVITPGPEAFAFAWFFLGCVIAAGAFGAATVSKRIFVVQALPAAIALALVIIFR